MEQNLTSSPAIGNTTVGRSAADKIALLKSKIKLKQSEIEVKEGELIDLQNELFQTEWVKISWIELQKWLQHNRPENNYEKNPVVSNGMNLKTYCRLNDDGLLQIGAYYHNDNFPRGKDVYVRYDFRSYRE